MKRLLSLSIAGLLLFSGYAFAEEDADDDQVTVVEQPTPVQPAEVSN